MALSDSSRTVPRALLALALGGFAIGVAEFVPMGLLPQIADGTGVSLPSAGHVVSAYALGVVLGAPVLAVAGARVARGRMLVWLMVAFSVANLASAIAPTFETLVAARVASGIPHGAYFGVGALVAAEAAGPRRRAWAVARMMLGLSVATVAGVPVATWVGQAVGWRAALALVGGLALAAAVALGRIRVPAALARGAGARGELSGLRRPLVWLTLGAGAVGLGGLFAVYAYIAPTLTARAGMDASAVPLALAAWGVGMVAGNVLSGPLFDRALLPGLLGLQAALGGALAAFTALSTRPLTAFAGVFLLGVGFALGPGLQTRLMDVAGEAQTLAAALHHAAFNAANALGPWLAGRALAHGAGWTAPAWIGVGLAAGGLALLAVSARVERRAARRPAAAGARR